MRGFGRKGEMRGGFVVVRIRAASDLGSSTERF